METEVLNTADLTEAQLQRLCKETGLNAGRKATMLDLHIITLCTNKEVRRMEAIPEADNTEEEGLYLDEEDLAMGPEPQLCEVEDNLPTVE
ncbi:hypothetical protein NDU88_005959 [Pleurodeles waltl]|uniref:Uncharacterized protein n=1 Tax=Pleurodeles waltl TaxID=8319 RepID=A0AAV7MCI8_PLEWA|nr:hypothetical protein NDU88_005959 [Pleurodeles waltl]